MKYKDKLYGKEFSFTVKPKEIMVNFSSNTDISDITNKFEAERKMIPLYASNVSGRFRCFTLISDALDIDSLKTNRI